MSRQKFRRNIGYFLHTIRMNRLIKISMLYIFYSIIADFSFKVNIFYKFLYKKFYSKKLMKNWPFVYSGGIQPCQT